MLASRRHSAAAALRRVTPALLIVASVLLPVPAAAADVPCLGAPADNPAAGYPQARSFIDTQTWWRPEAGQTGNDFGHVHLGLCFPDRETLAGTTTLHVRVLLHDNPGHGNYVSMVVKGTDYETTVQKVSLGGLTCPVGTCTRWLTFTLAASAFAHSGLQEVRFRGFVPVPDGNEMRANFNGQVYVSNGRSRADVSRQPYLRGKGWYNGSGSNPDAGYCEAAFLSVPLPDAAVSGAWSPRVTQPNHDASIPVTHHFVSLDPDFHASPPVIGTVLSDGSGPLAATAFSIDTTRLANGVHRLFQKASCRRSTDATNSGVLSVPFRVRN